MTKVKNIHGFPEEEELRYETHLGNAFNQADKDRMIFNQARKIIGELDITFDIDKMTKELDDLLNVYGTDMGNTYDIAHNKVKDLATALAKGDIIKGVSK